MAQPPSQDSTGSHQRKRQCSTMAQSSSQDSTDSHQMKRQYSAMAQSSSQDSTDSHQMAGDYPENVWRPYIIDHYPNITKGTNTFPPIYFRPTPQTVGSIAGQPVIVNVNPSERPPQLQPPPPPSDQDPNPLLFSANQSNLESVEVSDSYRQGDDAHQLCFSVLSGIAGQVMMIISSLLFRKYLSNTTNSTNPLYPALKARPPSIEHPSISEDLKDGECDVIIIHSQYGLVVGEVKSVGGSGKFHGQTAEEQNQVIIKKVKKSVGQIEKQVKVLKHLVSDLLPPVRIIGSVLLPNITTGQLQSALSTSERLLQELCQVLGVPKDISQAVRHCLCQDDLERADDWWRQLHSAGPDPCMTEDLYIRLVCRFCGPATTVEVPTAGTPRKVLRSQAQAVAEVGLRTSALVMTPAQVTLLNIQPEPQYIHLNGPPGTGKTICLLLKALQWVRQGRRVVMVSGSERSRAVTLLLKEQLLRKVEPAAADSIQQYSFDVTEETFDARDVVRELGQQCGGGRVLLIYDEAFSDGDSGRDMEWLEQVRDQLPEATVWIAGTYRLDRPDSPPAPAWLKVWTLQESLRCPPTVTTVLQQSPYIQNNVILPYTAPQHPAATEGPPVKVMLHIDQAGHSGDFPWQCDRCGEDVCDIIANDLRVGQPGHGLQYRDVFILYGGLFADPPRAGDVMVQQLQRRGLPFRAMTSRRLSEDDIRELALRARDVIVVADSYQVQGLERRVVIALNTGTAVEPDNIPSSYLYHPAASRCSSALYIIN